MDTLRSTPELHTLRETPDADASPDTPTETTALGPLRGATKHTIDCLGSLYSALSALNDLHRQARQFVEEELLPRHRQSHGATHASKQSN